MRQRLTFTCLLIGCLLTLVACSQSASVGIPTPDHTATAALATAAIIGPTSSPLPPPPQAETETPAPPPPPAPTATNPPPPPTAPPAETATATPVATRSGTTTGGTVPCNQQVIYIVKPGDNLFRIALRYRTTIYAIARLNGITNVRLVRAGQRLRIRTCTTASNDDPPGDPSATYTVKSGDRLFRIALHFGTTVEELMVANGLNTSIIVPGQILVIP